MFEKHVIKQDTGKDNVKTTTQNLKRARDTFFICISPARIPNNKIQNNNGGSSFREPPPHTPLLNAAHFSLAGVKRR
jgi:hypothetical protein